ncbi:MAG TPA: DUF4038 domain-containing protein, partial [Pyrinomonadaceae bacterium]|nr:DUF4038 domain-containing protein [Pyrinomonadaceae bacterium]
GDGDYRGEKAEKWKRIGRAVFGERPAQPVTMHMGGRHWVADEFRDEKWYGFHGYQSGHGDTEATWRWTVEGPPGRSWQKTPVHPSINLEPNYEAHNGGGSRKPFDAHAVRRAAYWSLLVTPPAGVSYGAHGIWSWQREAGEPLNHKGTGIAAPWHEAMNLPGSLHMKHLRALFESVEWWRLRPAQELLVEQPGKTDARRFVAIAKSNDGKLALAYLPEGGTIALRLETFNRIIAARWVNPRGGGWQRAKHVRIGASDAPLTFAAPDTNDWVLWVNFKERRRRYQGG